MTIFKTSRKDKIFNTLLTKKRKFIFNVQNLVINNIEPLYLNSFLFKKLLSHLRRYFEIRINLHT